MSGDDRKPLAIGEFLRDKTSFGNLFRVVAVDLTDDTVKLRRIGYDGVPPDTPAITVMSFAELAENYQRAM